MACVTLVITTVPTPIAQSSSDEVAGNLVDTLISYIEIGGDGENHAVDALLGQQTTRPVGNTAVDPISVVQEPPSAGDRSLGAGIEPQPS